MMESLSGSEANPSSEQGMTGGMLEYDNSFNEMLAADAQRRKCRCTLVTLGRFIILAPTAAHWIFLLWAVGGGPLHVFTGDASVDVTDSHNGTHKLHIDHTHQFTVHLDLSHCGRQGEVLVNRMRNKTRVSICPQRTNCPALFAASEHFRCPSHCGNRTERTQHELGGQRPAAR